MTNNRELTSEDLGVINFSDFTEEQLKSIEESHKKWVESGCWIPEQLYTEKYLDEEDSPKFPLVDRFVILREK